MALCRRRLSWSCGGPGSTVELGVCRCHREVLVVSVPLLARVALSNKRHCLSKMYNCIGAQGGDPYAPPKLGNAGRTHHARLYAGRQPPTDCLAHGRAGGTARQAPTQPHTAPSRTARYTTTTPRAPKGPKTKQHPETRGHIASIGDAIDPPIKDRPESRSAPLGVSRDTLNAAGRLARDIT